MKLKLNYLSLILLIVISIIGRPSYAKDSPADSSSSNIVLDAIYIDLTTIGLATDISIAADIEFTSDSIVSFGLQPSYSYFMAMYWSAKDISLLTYISLGHNFPLTLKTTIGFSSYHKLRGKDNGAPYDIDTYGETIAIKYGIAVILNTSKYFKIHAKYSWIHNIGVSAIGIGVSVGWSR